MALLQLTGTTYGLTMPDGSIAEVGDLSSATFKPVIKIPRWQGECSLTLALPTTENKFPVIDGNKVKWEGRNYGIESFPTLDGIKFNVILPKKPRTNVFPLDFEANNLRYHYQSSLTEKFKDGYQPLQDIDISISDTDVIVTASRDPEIPVGKVVCHRPENMVGGYAVYHATRGKLHVKGEGEKYKAGKAFDWLKPLIYDAAGNKTWGKLNVTTGLRTVTVPQAFLDTAIYPVTIDDEFGYHTIGASNTNLFAPGEFFVAGEQTYSPAANGTLDTIYGYCSDTGKGMRAFIYDTSDNYVDQSANALTDVGGAWKGGAVVVGASILAATAYRIGLHFGGTSMNHWWDDVGGGYRNRYSTSAFANPLPDPVTWTLYSTNSDELSVYAEYTASGGGVTVAPAALSAVGSIGGPGLVFGSTTVSAFVSAIGSIGQPSVIQASISISPAALSAIGDIAQPGVILGSMTIAPVAISAIGGVNLPTLIFGSMTISPATISVIADVSGPTVLIVGGAVTITPDAIAAVGATAIGNIHITGRMDVKFYIPEGSLVAFGPYAKYGGYYTVYNRDRTKRRGYG